MDEHDIFRGAMCIHNIALSLDDENLSKVKPWLREIEEILKHYQMLNRAESEAVNE